MRTEFDIVIIGAGLAGLTAALACAASGAEVAVLDRSAIQTGFDGRASALSTTSLRLFENLGVELTEKLQPIRDMLVTDGAPNSPWRLHFEGDGDGGDLGALIENPDLKTALIKRVTETSSIYSVMRRKAGITAQRFDYDAASLVTTISHSLPHDGLAWQRIIKGGALAVLPLTGNRSQIVWSGPTKAIKAAESVSEAAFLDLLSEKMDGYLGEMALAVPRQSYPLRLQVADGFSKGRVALVGDAAHAIHPLAGQGLNLGLRDAAALADGVKIAIETGQDIGVVACLDYDLWRNTDTRSLGFLTHVISEVSGTKNPLLAHARRLGLSLTNRSSPLKSALAKRASGDGEQLPNLMKLHG